MPIKLEFGGIELTGDVEHQPSEPDRSEGPRAVRIGVIGDFRGRGTARDGRAGCTPWPDVDCHRVDRDNLDRGPGRLAPVLSLTLPGAEGTPIVLTFRELDDFHPDRILAHAEVFAHLQSTPRPSRGPGHVRRARPPSSASAPATDRRPSRLQHRAGRTGHLPRTCSTSSSSNRRRHRPCPVRPPDRCLGELPGADHGPAHPPREPASGRADRRRRRRHGPASPRHPPPSRIPGSRVALAGRPPADPPARDRHGPDPRTDRPRPAPSSKPTCSRPPARLHRRLQAPGRAERGDRGRPALDLPRRRPHFRPLPARHRPALATGPARPPRRRSVPRRGQSPVRRLRLSRRDPRPGRLGRRLPPTRAGPTSAAAARPPTSASPCPASCCGPRTAREPSRSRPSRSRNSPALRPTTPISGATRPSPWRSCSAPRSTPRAGSTAAASPPT